MFCFYISLPTFSLRVNTSPHVLQVEEAIYHEVDSEETGRREYASALKEGLVRIGNHGI